MSEGVLSRYLATLVATLADQYGVAADRLYAEAGLEPLMGADRVTAPYADSLWAAAERLAGDGLLGLKVGARVRYGSYATLGHLLTTCDTVGESLAMACEQARYVGAGGDFELSDDRAGRLLTYTPVRTGWPAAQVRSEAVLLPFVRFAHWTAGVRPAAVFLKRDEPEDGAAFSTAFQAPVVFGAAFNGIRWAADVLNRPMSDANPMLKAVLSQQVAAEMDAAGSHTAHVSDWLTRRLADPLGLEADTGLIADCASGLGLSVRSLQRALRGEGQSFRSLLAGARRRTAQRFLKETKVPVADIALHLGYSEPAAFVRAFSRWCGTTPARFRRGM